MIRLRNLETRDALPMLEWMDDFDTTRYLQKDFQKYTLDDCLRFIEDSNRNTDSVHLCIDEDGVYCGTVSLKNLIVGKSAEFAIVMHPAARGKGIGSYALDIILNYGFNEKNLGLIYWSVRKDNIRAIRLYDKKGYGRSTCEMIEIKLGGVFRTIQRNRRHLSCGILSQERRGLCRRKFCAAKPYQEVGSCLPGRETA